MTYYGSDLPFAQLPVAITGATAQQVSTDASGIYASAQMDAGNYVVQPQMLGSLRGGVTALDAVFALAASVGLRTLTPEQYLACDSNGSGTLTAIDAVILLQYAVGLIDRLPMSERCGSDWVFVPVTDGLPANAQVSMPTSVSCQPGSVDVNMAAGGLSAVNFHAVKLGDCTGDWRPDAIFATPTSTPSWTSVPTNTPSPLPTSTAIPSATATRTALPTFTATAVPTWTFSPTFTLTWSPTRTLTPTLTYTPTPTQTSTPSASATRTNTQTASPTRTATATATWSPTNTSTATATATATTATVSCATDPSTLASPLLIASHPAVADSLGIVRAGRAHVVTTVPTSGGWGIFWLRDKTENTFDVTLPSTLWYAHVSFAGRISAGPLPLVDIHRHDREPLYLVNWRVDHFGLLVNELTNTDLTNKITYQYYYDVDIDGRLSARVGPIRTDLGFSGGIGDIVPYLDGFMVGIETVCQGSHQCSFAYKLADHGSSRGADLHIVEFDGTHSFAPKFAYDGRGLAVTSWKDSLSAGVVSQYIADPGSFISASRSVVPNKGSLNDNNPRVAWDGQRFAVAWRELQSLTAPGNSLWRMRMATFSRNSSTSTLISDHFLEPAYVLDSSIARSLNFSTDMNAVSDGWVVGYARGRLVGEPDALVQYVTSDGIERASWSAGTLDDYAFSTRVHTSPGYQRVLGIARTHRVIGGVQVYFSRLNLDCPP